TNDLNYSECGSLGPKPSQNPEVCSTIAHGPNRLPYNRGRSKSVYRDLAGTCPKNCCGTSPERAQRVQHQIQLSLQAQRDSLRSPHRTSPCRCASAHEQCASYATVHRSNTRSAMRG